MIGARGNAPADQLAVAFEENQANIAPVADQDVAVSPLERGAGDNAADWFS